MGVFEILCKYSRRFRLAVRCIAPVPWKFGLAVKWPYAQLPLRTEIVMVMVSCVDLAARREGMTTSSCLAGHVRRSSVHTDRATTKEVNKGDLE